MAVEMFSLTGAPLCSGAYELEAIPEAHRRTERDADENGMGRLHICSAVTLKLRPWQNDGGVDRRRVQRTRGDVPTLQDDLVLEADEHLDS